MSSTVTVVYSKQDVINLQLDERQLQSIPSNSEEKARQSKESTCCLASPFKQAGRQIIKPLVLLLNMLPAGSTAKDVNRLSF